MEDALPPDHAPVPGPAIEPVVETPTIVPPALALTNVGEAPAPPPLEIPAYTDRGTGLVIFGVVQIILGLLTALMVPFVLLGAFVGRLAQGGGMRPGQIISGAATYTLAAAALLTLGIGSVQMKRWARALTLVTSWYWLIMGALITVLMTAVLPVAMKGALAQISQSGADAPSPGMSAGIMAVVLTLIIVFMAFFLIAVPIAFVVFYSRNDVAETCRHRDPVARWTDRTPLPVLGASVALFCGAIYLFLVGVTTPLFPFFGHYLTGIAAVGCFLVLSAVDIYVSIALFRLQSAGWWIAVVTLAIRVLSMALTYLRADLMEAYSKLGLSDAQLQVMTSNPMLRSHVMLWWGLISSVLFFGYLIWLKRYFRAPVSTDTVVPPVAIV